MRTLALPRRWWLSQPNAGCPSEARRHFPGRKVLKSEQSSHGTRAQRPVASSSSSRPHPPLGWRTAKVTRVAALERYAASAAVMVVTTCEPNRWRSGTLSRDQITMSAASSRPCSESCSRRRDTSDIGSTNCGHACVRCATSDVHTASSRRDHRPGNLVHVIPRVSPGKTCVSDRMTTDAGSGSTPMHTPPRVHTLGIDRHRVRRPVQHATGARFLRFDFTECPGTAPRSETWQRLSHRGFARDPKGICSLPSNAYG